MPLDVIKVIGHQIRQGYFRAEQTRSSSAVEMVSRTVYKLRLSMSKLHLWLPLAVAVGHGLDLAGRGSRGDFGLQISSHFPLARAPRRNTSTYPGDTCESIQPRLLFYSIEKLHHWHIRVICCRSVVPGLCPSNQDASLGIT